MCLKIPKDDYYCKKKPLRFNKKGYATMYKVYKRCDPFWDNTVLLLSLYKVQTIYQGVIKSNRKNPLPGEDCLDYMFGKDNKYGIGINKGIVINRGIHCYRSKRAAKKWEHLYPERKIVPVKVHKKDLVACNEKEAVFMKIFLYAKDYKEALR